MPTLPPGALNLGTIRSLALRRAGNLNLVYDAGVWLSQLLYDLYTEWDWPFLFVSTPILLTGNTFTLPTDFLKMQDDNSFEVHRFDGTQMRRLFIDELDHATFVSVAHAGRSMGGMPEVWWPDRAAGTGEVFPNPIGHAVQTTFRYKRLPTADTTAPDPLNPTANDAVVPTFPWGLYLVQALFTQVLQYDMDPRADTEMAKTDAMIARIRKVAMPLNSVEATIPLDDTVFGPTFSTD